MKVPVKRPTRQIVRPSLAITSSSVRKTRQRQSLAARREPWDREGLNRSPEDVTHLLLRSRSGWLCSFSSRSTMSFGSPCSSSRNAALVQPNPTTFIS